MKLSLKVGSTSQTVNVFLQDSSSTVGAGLSGLVFNTSGLTAYYALPKAAPVAITLATLAAATTAYSSGGFFELDATHTKGLYRLDLPDAAIASGRFANIYIYGATNLAPCVLEIELTAWDNQDAVHGGMSAIPNTACTTNASLITSGTGTDQLSLSAGKVLLQATQSGVTIPTVTTVTNQLTAAAIATGVWQDSTAGDFTTANSIGKCLYISNVAPGSANGLATVGASLTVGTNNDKTGYSLSVTPPTSAQIATAVWTDTTAGDFTTALSIGKSIMNGVSLGTGLTINAYTGNTPQTGDVYAQTNSGTFGLAAIKGYVDDIGVAGAGLTALGDTRIANLDATVSSRASTSHFDTILGTPASSVSADIAAVKTDTGNLVTRITATLFSGITSLAKWLGIVGGKVADAGTLAEVNATTAGASYDNTTDSLQALKDAGVSVSLTSGQMNQIADHVRRRTQANVFASSDGDAISIGSQYGQIQQTQNQSISGATGTVLNPDNTTLGTITYSSTNGVDPITSASVN